MHTERIGDGPIITPQTPGGTRIGTNINGPSLIKAPAWVEHPIARYYLYFAHHDGDHIRLALADNLDGPYRIHTPGVLELSQTDFPHHIASPDVHVDEENRQLVMYFHGCCRGDDAPWQQPTQRAVSRDGLVWEVDGVDLGESYFRVFAYRGRYYAIAKGGRLYRSPDGIGNWQERAEPIDSGEPGHGRHWAVWRAGDVLHVFFSRWNDQPEHILYATMDLAQPWEQWKLGDPVSVLRSEHDWEGVNQPIRPSTPGAAGGPVHELRDPALHEENGDLYLLYTTAGESGIALARIWPER